MYLPGVTDDASNDASSNTKQVVATAAKGASIVLLSLAAGQFVMTLDSSVMNVSIVQISEDVGTDVVGIQTAITLYTLVMATLMITGGKIGQLIGRKRAFLIGGVIYGAGSLTTAVSQSLPMLLFGWSLLEGIGAALILPAIVALVASNFEKKDRPRAYGLVSAAGAIAVAAGPLIGGLCTTYLTWRVVFVGEVVILAAVLVFAKLKMSDTPAEPGVNLDLVGTAFSVVGLGVFVFGVLRAGSWGFVKPKAGGREWLGLSMSFWLMVVGALVMVVFLHWEQRVIAKGGEPLVDPALLKVEGLRAGLVSFFFQFMLQSGMFFLLSLYLTVALGLSAVATGVRLMPLSVALLLAAVGIPKRFPDASPRRVVRLGFLAIVAGLVVLIALMDVNADASIVTWPLILAGLGIGALASQLGAATVGAVPEERSSEVGGLQNTATNLGASIATALAGAVLIVTLTSSIFTGLQNNPQVDQAFVSQAQVELSAGVPFVSDADLSAALATTGLPADQQQAIIDENEKARVTALKVSLAVLVLLGIVALLGTAKLPEEQLGQSEPAGGEPAPASA